MPRSTAMPRTTAGTRRITTRGNAKCFHGATGYLDIAQGSITFSPSDSFTLELRARFSDPQTSSNSIIGALFKAGSTSAIVINMGANGVIQPFVRDDSGVSNGTATSGHAALNDNLSHHVALVVDGTLNKIRVFIDGVIRNGDPAYTRTGNIVTAINMFVGCRNGRGTADQFAKCIVDEVRFSNVARYTETFTPPNFNTPYVSDANTIFLLHLDETGTPIDSSGSPKTVTVVDPVGNEEGYMGA